MKSSQMSSLYKGRKLVIVSLIRDITARKEQHSSVWISEEILEAW